MSPFFISEEDTFDYIKDAYLVQIVDEANFVSLHADAHQKSMKLSVHPLLRVNSWITSRVEENFQIKPALLHLQLTFYHILPVADGLSEYIQLYTCWLITYYPSRITPKC